MLNFWFKCEQENLILKFMYWPLENLVQSSLVISLLLVQELSWLQDQDWLAYAIQAHFGTGIWAKWALKFIFKKDIPVWVSISDGHWKISIQFQKIREIVGCTKVGWPLDVAWQNSSLQIFTCFHHFFVPFRGFEPHSRRFFFMKSDIKWAFLHIF